MSEKIEKPRKPAKPKKLYRIVNAYEFERLLGEALASTTGRARRRLHEGALLRQATVGEIEWAYTARQAIFFALVRKRGYSADVAYGRFVAMDASEWQRQISAGIVSLTPAAEAVRRRVADHPDPREALEARAVIEEVAAELAQEPLMLLPEESPCGCIPYESRSVPLIDRPRQKPKRERRPLRPRGVRRNPAQLEIFAATHAG